MGGQCCSPIVLCFFRNYRKASVYSRKWLSLLAVKSLYKYK